MVFDFLVLIDAVKNGVNSGRITNPQQFKKYNMLIDQIHALKPQLIGLAAQHGASHLRVFGSVARGQERADSDVDFLVELPRGYDLFGQRIPLMQGLSDMLHRKIDLVPEHELNRHLREQVLREAVEI